MKKLMIAMTAAAIGTCAWAVTVGVADATLLDQNFNKSGDSWNPANWTVAEGGKVSAVADPWSYAGGTDVGDGELTLENNALTLNTGSKVLNGEFAGGDAVTIPDTNVFFNATVKFKDPSDTLPTLADGDKFALVVLDNVDSLPNETDSNRATNLWVIAGYGTAGEPRAYKLAINNKVNLDSAWFDEDHEIVVKAYADATKGSSTVAGFLVMVDEHVCQVVYSYAITGDTINYSTAIDGINGDKTVANSAYLGLVKSDIADNLQERYGNAQLIIAKAFGDTLTSVDFQGQGTIDEVSLAATSTAAFGDDVTVKKLTFTYDANGVSSIANSGVNLVGGVFTIPANTASGASFEFSVTLNNNYALTSDNQYVTIEGTAPNYKLTYEYQGGVAETVVLNVFEPVASVGDTPYDTFNAARDAAAKVEGTIKIVGTVNSIEINPGQTLTIDLNGRTIGDIYNDGNLTITNSAATIGTVMKSGNDSVSGEGSLTIYGGRFEGAVAGVDKSIYGGEFAENYKPVDGALAEGKKFGVLTGDYWPVVDDAGSDYTDSKDLVNVDGATEEQKAAVTEQLEAIDDELAKLGATTGDAGVKAYIQAAYGEGETVPVTTLLAAKNIGISVANNLPLMTSENAEFVAEAVAADDGNVAAFEFTLQDGSADKVLPLTVKAKLEKIIKVCTDLNTWVNAKIEAAGVADADVKATVSNGKVKVQLKSKTGGKCFMKLKAE